MIQSGIERKIGGIMIIVVVALPFVMLAVGIEEASGENETIYCRYKGGYDTVDYAFGVAVVGNYAYVADDDNGLVIVDVSDPENPTLEGHYDTAGNARGVAVNGNHTYVADGGNGLVIVDVTNITNPTKNRNRK